MTRRKKIIIAVIVLLLLLLAALLWYLLNRPAPAAPVVNTGTSGTAPRPSLPAAGSPTTYVPAAEAPVLVPAQPAPEDGQATLRALAMAFAERFGSYSTEGDFQNILDLGPLMTAGVRTWSEGYVAEQRTKPVSGFSGTTTRSLNARFGSYDGEAGTADITVSTQRREVSTVAGERVYYQDLALKYVKRNGTWLVDFVRWGESPLVE
jgi:hypothetical protein